MSVLGNIIQSGDWMGEKHVPAIIANNTVKKGELLEVKVSVGEEIAHPNTLEHHISWIKVFYIAEGSKFAVELSNNTFDSNGEGQNFTEPSVTGKYKLEKSGTIVALSYCNIHGLWESSLEVTVE